MIYYDSKGVAREFFLSKTGFGGYCASLYKIDNEEKILKSYDKRKVSDAFRIDYETFELLKTINHSNFISLTERYYSSADYDKKKIKKVLKNAKNYLISAYVYDYIVEDEIRVTEMPTDYFLDNINRIENLFEIFADEKVSVNDLKPENMVLNRENMVMIDPDFFRREKDLNEEEIASQNKWKLRYLILDLIMEDIGSDDYEEEFQELFYYLDDKSDESFSIQLLKKIGSYKRPIDYLRRRSK